MTIKEIKEQNLVILECISGSRAYGLHTPESDTDIKGVFVYPKEKYYGLDYIPQIANENNDEVYYELGRFIELLSVNNPNILELLGTPNEAVLYKDPILNILNTETILSKLCQNTFGKFAISQIKKSRGLNKKIVNPMEKERKSVLDFCFVNYENGSLPLKKFLELKSWKQEECGLVAISKMKNVFGLYHSYEDLFKGVVKSVESNNVALSSIPKGMQQQALLYFNMDGYSRYCKDYQEYWDWVVKRNEHRFLSTLQHGKQYDAKNMMHTFRLLNMAIEIATEKKVNVHRKDRDFLLKIKSGAFEYDELLEMANAKQNQMQSAFASSDLQMSPDIAKLNHLAYELRAAFYLKS